MSESLIIGYGVSLDSEGRVLLLRGRSSETLWPGRWWLPGDVTPLSEEPDDTVPRLFAQLLRQRVGAAYACTVYGPEPTSGRHTIHNAYLVTVEEALDGAPDVESNPFDAMEWWDIESALAELPDQQSELLATVIERLGSGWDFEADTSLDDLFDENDPLAAFPQPGSDSLAERDISLARLAARVAASNALGRELDWESEARSALKLGWTQAELDQVGVVAAELGRAASLECAPTNDQEN